MPLQQLPIFNYYDRQRFRQFNPMDCANWYLVSNQGSKKGMAMYPAMGRHHVEYLNQNRLIFNVEPRALFRSIDYMYIIVGSQVYKVDRFFNVIALQNQDFTTAGGFLDFAFLPLIQKSGLNQFQRVFCMLTNGVHCFVIDEQNNTMTTVTDPNAPVQPRYVAAFGNRFAVSATNSTEFRLTQVNLGANYDPTDVFTISGSAVFAQEVGIIRQMVVLHNQLYIFSDFRTGIWSNSPSSISSASGAIPFPWRRNTSLEFDYGMADDNTLDVGFDMMVWLGQNRGGTVDFLMSNGQSVQEISTQAINTLLQRATNEPDQIPFFLRNSSGFLYQYENTVFYRAVAGLYSDEQILDLSEQAACIEYNFDTKTWARGIELNGSRNRIQKHAYFNNRHFVTVQGEGTVYEMGGQYYTNELRNPDQPNPQEDDAYIQYPFRYETITPIIAEENYEEFMTKLVQIDFVWGEASFINFYSSGFDYSDLNSPIYYAEFKPHVELYYSDNGGISFYSAGTVEFSQLGVYSWRMRWYNLNCSRNRVYKLIVVSSAPIVILGGMMETEIVSGGAY